MRGTQGAFASIAVPALGLSFVWPYFRASFLTFAPIHLEVGASVVHQGYMAYVGACMVCALLALLGASRVQHWINARFAPLALGLGGALGNALLWIPAPDAVGGTLYAVGAAVATVFFVGAVLCYGTRLASWDRRRAAIVGFASFGLSFLDNAAIAGPALVGCAFCIGAPLVCAACTPTPTSSAPQPVLAHGAPSTSVLVALGILLALFCVSGNIVRGLTNPWVAYEGPTLRALGMSLANLVLAVVSIALLARNLDVRKVLFWNWTAWLALFFVGLFALAFFKAPLAGLGSDIATVSRVCFTLFMFLFALEATSWTSTGIVRLLALFLLIPEALAACARRIVAPALLAWTGMEPLAIASTVGVAVILALIVAMTVALGKLLLKQVSPEHAPAAVVAAPPVSPQEAALEQLARTYGLTAREVQTASYVSTGYSLEKTADLLGISINTVRTHMRSIYGKLDIHSRQELIDVLDSLRTPPAR